MRLKYTFKDISEQLKVYKMVPGYNCKKLFCCCVTEKNSEKQLKKKAFFHKYCGCRESKKHRGRQGKMKSCDVDRRALVDEEVFEAIDYDFISNEDIQEDCLVENPVSKI